MIPCRLHEIWQKYDAACVQCRHDCHHQSCRPVRRHNPDHPGKPRPHRDRRTVPEIQLPAVPSKSITISIKSSRSCCSSSCRIGSGRTASSNSSSSPIFCFSSILIHLAFYASIIPDRQKRRWHPLPQSPASPRQKDAELLPSPNLHKPPLLLA